MSVINRPSYPLFSIGFGHMRPQYKRKGRGRILYIVTNGTDPVKVAPSPKFSVRVPVTDAAPHPFKPVGGTSFAITNLA